MPCSGCSVLHGVNPNKKSKINTNLNIAVADSADNLKYYKVIGSCGTDKHK